jgi:site-specific recombinase XerD
MNVTFATELKKTPKANGKHPLFLRITANRKSKRISLGYEIPLSDWNPEKKVVRKSNPFFKSINEAIENAINDAKTKQKEAKVFSAGAVKAVLKNQASDSFFAYADALALKKNFNTSRGLKSDILKFRTFVKNPDLTFDEINRNLIESFAKYLADELGNQTNTIGKTLSRIRSIIRQSIKDEKMPMERNPFFHIEIKHQKTDKVRLNLAQIEALECLNLEGGSLAWNIRNYWLFAFYSAGMRFSDVAMLKWKHIENDRIRYVMEKTEQSHSVKLNQKNKSILEAYKPETVDPEGYVFPILDTRKQLTTESILKMEISRKNALANKYLSILSGKLELPQKISFHCSRHSFADFARKKDIGLYEISKLLNHSKLSITEAYLKDFDTDSTDKAMDQLFD